MRCAQLVLVLNLVLAGPAFAAPQADDGADARAGLVIESGRLVVMMDQTREALKLLEPGRSHADLASSAAERAYAFQELVTAVLHYNLLEARACRDHQVAATHCTGPWLPAWLEDRPGTDHSEARLRAMVDEASARLVPFWTDLCAKGRAKAKDDHFCDLE